MKRYYANLLGNWTDITECATVQCGQRPGTFFEDNPQYLNGELSSKSEADCFISVETNNKQYFVHPSCIQCVTETDA